jgi:hypothetical protein
MLLSTLALFGACNGQSEGEVCDTLNNSADCQNGYFCKPPSGGVKYARCCPGDIARATTAVCGLNQGAGTDASSAVPDAGLTDGDASLSADVVEDATSSDGASDGD